ncbi:MAG: efflux RND transporter permease subunit, partial [Parvularculales bacterium]
KERGSGFVIHEELRERVKNLPGINVEITQQKDGPPTGKDVQIELTSTDYEAMVDTASFIREHLDKNVAGLIDLEDTRPLPGVEWELDVDREKAGRFGTDVSSIGAFVQLVTTGALIGEYRPHDADEEVEIRARFPHEYRNIDQLDQLRITTPTGSVPISNFVTRWPTPKISSIERIDGLRRIEIKANTTLDPATGQKILADDKVGEISAWLEQQDINPLVQVRFRGANEEQADAQEFLGRAMLGVLFLMFVILLTQFNSFYHSILTLSTVVLSTVGVMAGMIITGQTFSVIMTGTGIVALAGIVVNNSIVLIDTYQRLLRDGLDQIEAALRTAGQRLRPILLTTITTVCGLMPMAVKMNINFFERDIVLGDPISYWWSQMATAIIFGLGFSTMLTLVLVPVLLAAPAVWRDRRTERMGKLPTETTPTPAE